MATPNPFAIPGSCWILRFEVPKSLVPVIEESFSDIALAVANFEIDEKTALWQVDIIAERPPADAELIARCALIAELHGEPLPPPAVQLVEKKDWVSETARSFPPLKVGRFYVYGTHVEKPLPPSLIGLHIDAGMAFGSGEHATTSGCLTALSELSKSRRFGRMLDMGCGSAILAIGMAKCWKRKVLATDIDPVSVAVARENIALNRESKWVRAAVQDGFRGKYTNRTKFPSPAGAGPGWGSRSDGGRVQRNTSTPTSILPQRGRRLLYGGPFDLIVANILARPLVRMAPAMVANLAPGGVIVLSGLLASQQAYVLHAYRAQGMHLARRILLNDWATLVLGR